MLRVVFAIWMLLAVAGCRFTQTRGSEGAGYRNEPSGREEAQQLMAELDDKAASEHWDAAVAQRVREQMRGRLLVAGIAETEINAWVAQEGQAQIHRKRGTGRRYE